MKASIALCCWLVALPVFAGTVTYHEIDSPSIGKNAIGIPGLRHIEVYLPSGYDAGNDRYPVLYYIPGFGLPASGMPFKKPLDKAIQQGTMPPTMVVFIDVHEGICALDSSFAGNWQTFIVTELVPFIDKTYRTIPNAQARGLVGHSLGGYAALMLAVLHPSVWGSIGLNDPATWLMNYPIADKVDIHSPNEELLLAIEPAYRTMPNTLEGSFNITDATTAVQKALLEVGGAFSPNPRSPILSDMPKTRDGQWVEEIRDKWRNYDLTNAKTLIRYSETLKKLSSISIIVPEVMDPNQTNSVSSISLVDKFLTAGIIVTRIDMPGDHMTDVPGRFIALAERLLGSMKDTKR